MSDSQRMEKIVGRTGDLPSIPAIVHDVMEITSDANVALSDVSALIEKDIALTAKLLKVSNSSYYGMRQVVGTLKLALVILGVREVRNIVLAISILDTLRNEETEVLMGEHGLWNHSITVAGIAKRLGAHLELSLQGEDFIAGLIHDVGQMVLWKQLGQEYRDLYRRAKDEDLALHELENDTYGFDHADVAAAIAGQWHFPATLECAIRSHHAREDRQLAQTEAPVLASLIRISNLAAYDAFDPDNPVASASSLDDEAWSILAEAQGPPPPQLVRSEIIFTFKEDLKQSPQLAL